MNESMKPLASLLTGRELVRIARQYVAEHGHDADRSRAEYNAGMRAVAVRLYPSKVSV